MTEREASVLRIVTRYWEVFGYSPSYTEMADELCLKSKAGVHRLIMRLIGNGYLVRDGGGFARSLKPVHVDGPCPLCGRGSH